MHGKRKKQSPLDSMAGISRAYQSESYRNGIHPESDASKVAICNRFSVNRLAFTNQFATAEGGMDSTTADQKKRASIASYLVVK